MGREGPVSADSAGVIHNIGYQAYEGPRLGRAHIVGALTWHSLRSAFGFGRGVKAKIVPVLTFIVICLPAVVNAVAVALNHQHTRLLSYDTYLPQLRIFVLIVFIAAQAPDLVSRDLRSHCLPLYFARPIERIDYPVAKLIAFFTALLIMIEVPLLLLYVGTATQLHTSHQIWLETKALIPGLLLGVAWAAVLCGLGLLFASFSGRRAYATGAVAIFFLVTMTLATVLTHIGEQPGVGQGLSKLAGLISPFTVLDGGRQWLGGTTAGIVPNPHSDGPLYALMFAVFLLGGIGGLIFRYRKVGVG